MPERSVLLGRSRRRRKRERNRSDGGRTRRYIRDEQENQCERRENRERRCRTGGVR